MELTAAEPRRHRLTQLYIDGEEAVKIDTETFLRSGLRPGDELDDEELHDLIEASEAHRAKERAGAPQPLEKGADGEDRPGGPEPGGSGNRRQPHGGVRAHKRRRLRPPPGR